MVLPPGFPGILSQIPLGGFEGGGEYLPYPGFRVEPVKLDSVEEVKHRYHALSLSHFN